MESAPLQNVKKEYLGLIWTRKVFIPLDGQTFENFREKDGLVYNLLWSM